MTNTEYLVRKSSLYSCVLILQRTTRRSKGLGKLIPPSETVTEKEIASIPYNTTLAAATPCAAVDENHAYRIANAILATIQTNPTILHI